MAVQPTEIMWGSMVQCGIIFEVSVLSVVAGSLCNEIIFYLKHKPTYKAILYTNTKSSAKGHLLMLVKKAITTHTVDGDAIPLTGDSGLMMKNCLVSLFSGAIESKVSNLRVLIVW